MSSVATWVSIGVAVAAAGTSAGMAAAGVGQPNYPDLGSGSRAVSDANAELLPWRRRLEAMAQQGGKYEIPAVPSTLYYFIPGKGTEVDSQGRIVNNGVKPTGEWVKEGDPRLDTLNVKTLAHKGVGGIAARTIDFTGLGEADVKAKLADEMAKIQLELSKKYDSQFIDESLKQQALADPESVAARAKIHELIQQQIDAKPDRPVAGLLDQQIKTELAAANDKTLTPEMRAILDSSITKALMDRGGQSAGGDFGEELTTGFEGEKRRNAASQKALSWLSSGQTPEDVDYRREQQNLSNLSAEISGRTPQSQFGSLSAAQQGPTPFSPGQPLPNMPGNQGSAYQSAVNGMTTAGAMNQGANPWIVGLSGATSLAGAIGQSGYKPLA